MRRFSFHCAMVVLVAAFTGCGGEALRVTSIDLGRSVNADSTIAAHSTTFEPGDTIYLSVSTAGVGSATIRVRWMYGSRVVGEPTKEVSYKDVAATEFNLRSATGFPPGAYTAEVFLDGQSVGTRSFRVEQ